jgi:type VI secretion system protein ImpL
MSAVLAFLISRWFLSFIGTALLALVLWFFGPFLSWLEDWPIRLVIVSCSIGGGGGAMRP